jgi:hypothetical protein
MDGTVNGDGWDMSWVDLTHIALPWGVLAASFCGVVRWPSGMSPDGVANGNESTREVLEKHSPKPEVEGKDGGSEAVDAPNAADSATPSIISGSGRPPIGVSSRLALSGDRCRQLRAVIPTS